MSGFQALEPQPTAEVVVHTTAGDLRLELFAKQTSQTSRNFLQLCLDGYYENTIFHRLVPGFIIQGGDPTGTGSGGESSFNGEPFADEFHSRLKFNRRGLLGMANSGTKNDNGSQFFLTLGETPELNGRNTMFGRISAEGDTIYNLMKLAEADVIEGTERPQYPSKITGADIVRNPFGDMVKRVTEAPRTAVTKDRSEVARKPKRKVGKNVLSFGGDDEDGMEAMPVVKKPKFNPALVNTGKETVDKPDDKLASKAKPEKASGPPSRQTKQEAERPQTLTTRQSRPLPTSKRSERSPSPSDSDSDEDIEEDEKESKAFISRTNDEIAKLKASMKRTVPTAPVPEKPSTGLAALIPTTATRGRKRQRGGNAKDESAALDLFDAFRAKLDAAPGDASTSSPLPSNGANGTSANGDSKAPQKPVVADEEAILCDLHFIANCQSCTKWDEQGTVDEDDADRGWMSHALSFAKDRLGKDLEWKRKNEEELVVIDPREKARGLKEERRKDKPRDERRK